MTKQQRERITERNRPKRRIVEEDAAGAPEAGIRNPVVATAVGSLVLAVLLGGWSFFTTEPTPPATAAPEAPAIDGLPEGFDIDSIPTPNIDLLQDDDDSGAVEGDVDEGAEGDADAGEGAEDAPVESDADEDSEEGAPESGEGDGATESGDAAGDDSGDGDDEGTGDEGGDADDPPSDGEESGGEDDAASDDG